MSAEPVEEYLDELYARLRTDPRSARRLLDEAADHLHAAAAGFEAAGLDRVAAERAAIEHFGPSGPLADGDRQRTFRRLLLDTAFAGTALGGVGLVAIGVSGLLAGLLGALFGDRFVGGGLAGSVFGGAPVSTAEDAGDAVSLRVLAGLVGLVVLAGVCLIRRRGLRLRLLPVGYVDTVGLAAFAAATVALTAFSVDQAVQHHGAGTGFFLSGAVVALVGAVVFAVRAVRTVLA